MKKKLSLTDPNITEINEEEAFFEIMYRNDVTPGNEKLTNTTLLGPWSSIPPVVTRSAVPPSTIIFQDPGAVYLQLV